MLIKSIELENIRSYLHAKVEFPEGTVLLSGDVGCGKTSLLLAIEFALFGIQRGELSGPDLLRHGKDSGSVRLVMEVAGKKFAVHRTLKREKKGVVQDSCYIEIDSLRLQKTAGEIRAMVLELLGYPFEYITKNPIIYRYTVYTPQDEMKRILFADSDERLSILRKILGIDKYGRIRLNATGIASKELRAMRRELEAAAADLQKKEKELGDKRTLVMGLGEDYVAQKARADEAAAETKKKEEELEAIAGEIRELSRLKEDIARKESSLREKEHRRRQIEKELSDISAKLAALEKELQDRPEKPADISEAGLLEKKRNLEKRRTEVTSEKSVLDSELRKLQAIFQKGRCDFCEQPVSDVQSFRSKIEERKASAASISDEITSLSGEILDAERLSREMVNYNFSLRMLAQKEREHSEKKALVSSRQTELERNRAEAFSIEQELVVLKGKALELPVLEAAEKKAKAELSYLQQKKAEAERQVARTESQIEALTRECNYLENEVMEKQKKKEKALKVADSLNWIEEKFVPLMEAMEKSVMLAVQEEFNGFFQKWFSMVMGTENLSVYVDDRFSPVIEQEGYQTDYANLSGGEKTAVALAYRLALNKAINSLIETIRTKDVIILDEPTDGFSGDQIDRIRGVLQELSLRQMIIVSHEPKIDTFVDHVIKFHKEGHVSRVVSAG
jgi:exonuclease SbcC